MTFKFKKRKNGFWHGKDSDGEHILSPSGYYKQKLIQQTQDESKLVVINRRGIVMEKKRDRFFVSTRPLSPGLLDHLTDGKHQLCLTKPRKVAKKKVVKKKVVKKKAAKKVVKKKVVKKAAKKTIKQVVKAGSEQPVFFKDITTYEKGFVTRAKRDREVYRLAQEADLGHRRGSKQWNALHDRKKAIQKGVIKMPRISPDYRLTNGDLCAVAVLGWSSKRKEGLAGKRWPGFLNNAVVREWPKSCRKILDEKGWV